MVVAEKECKEVKINLGIPHAKQREFMESRAKRKVVRAGRRAGKTRASAMMAARAFLRGRRVLYTAPTSEQTDAFWFEVITILDPLINLKNERGFSVSPLKVNVQERYIERIGTKNRLKAKTAWNADSMRGDYADLLIFDEFQLTNEDAWDVIGAPMLMDNNGDAVFVYTPPSLRSAGVSKARDPRHAAKLFKAAQADTTGRWQAFHFTSHDNPYISQDALRDLLASGEMSKQSYRQEILAEDDEIQTTWLVYGNFNEMVCKIPRFEIPPNWSVYSGHDFGQANPAGLFFAQVRLPLPSCAPPYMRLNDLVCFKEYLPHGMGAPQHVLAFKEIVKGHTVARSVGGNVTSEEQTRQLYGLHGWPISAPTITHVNAQIERVIGLMELNKVYVFNDCTNLIEELMNCMWELDNENRTTNKVKDEARFHLLACARYILSNFIPETITKGFTPVSVPKWRM